MKEDMGRLGWILAGMALACGLLPGAEADAVAISAQIQARHLPFGTILDPFYESAVSDRITGYTRCGDSAIWTGHYLAAEVYRYRVTGEGEALANARKAVAALRGLVEVTGTGLLARCRIPVGSPFAAGIHSEEAANGVYTNTALGVTWIGNTSRDQYLGVAYGLGVAYALIPQAEMRTAVRETMTQMTDFLLANNWTAPMPDGRAGTTFVLRPDQQLGILQVARLVNPERFGAVYESQRARQAGTVGTPVAFDSLSTSSYFKFNLIYITFFHLLGLEEGGARETYARAYATARNYTAGHGNPFFNTIDRALFGPDARRDAETVALLELWLRRPRRDHYVDLRGKVEVCEEQACQPVPVDQRTPTDFLWQRNPYQLFGGGNGTIGNAGVDYILPYWMARYYGVIADFAVQSAAGPVLDLAPGAIGSLYGTGFAARSVAAASRGKGLEGLQIRVLDGTGGEKLAWMIFVSPGQVNFAMPDDVAEGPAVLRLEREDGRRWTAPVLVRRTAPALFTMDGRLAAATAVRVRGGVQEPVAVFSCAAAGCVAVPIALAEAAPVYLTLYGTGLRLGRTASATVGGVGATVTYAGVQPGFLGLDQVNLEAPVRLRGRGSVEILLTVDGAAANPVYVSFQ